MNMLLHGVKDTEFEIFHGFNLNISRYISTAVGETEIVLADTHRELVEIEKSVKAATIKHNQFLNELGLPALPL